jgi:hypothetical protein
MKGCLKTRGRVIKRKQALTITDLTSAVTHYEHSTNHDDFLFLAILVTGFHGLLRLGELTLPG